MRMHKIGSVALSGPFFLAPMAGFTDQTYRAICSEHGASLVYTEMVSAKGFCFGNRKTPELLGMEGCICPTAVQLFGSDPQFMARATVLAEPLGNSIIDVNMGCPVPKVVKNGDGSALLRNPEMIYKIVKAMCAETDKPVTVKIRTGIQGAKPDAAFAAAQAAQAGGAKAIAVHGRTREQYYSGDVDIEAMARVVRAVDIPVIGSGNIDCFEAAAEMMKGTGVTFVMVGRAALGDPWIFRRLNAEYNGEEPLMKPSVSEIADMMTEHYERMEKAKGEYIAVREMRKFAGRYLKGLKGGAAIRGKINTVTSGREFRALINGALHAR